ncbi:MAG: YggT family protein [Micrococcales bacterium]|nr:YggT family protein [Micrococcales bacterium]
MRIVFTLLYLVTLVYLLLLLVRLVLSWVQVFAREWRPTGGMLVVAEVVYSATDPPLKALRKVLPPVSLGQIRLDLGFLVLALGCSLLLNLFAMMANR